MREPQGLTKYYCHTCERGFIVGLVDESKQKPKFCPYCGPDGSISADAYVEPDDENYDWLDEMG